jgi:predicted small lipoprotein YifL
MYLPAFPIVRPLHALFLASVALTVAGCGAGGPAFHPVSGKLTIDGQIPANVQVSFYPVDGKGPIASGTVDAGTGRYELTSSGGVGKPAGKGAVAGKYKVVLNVGSGGGTSNEAMMAQYSGGNNQGKAPAVPKASFSKEFGSATTSPKEVEVKSGANAIDLAL